MLNVGKVLLFMGLQLLLFVVDIYVFCYEEGFFRRVRAYRAPLGSFSASAASEAAAHRVAYIF